LLKDKNQSIVTTVTVTTVTIADKSQKYIHIQLVMDLTMSFYNRDNELATLNSTYTQSQESGKMVVITGRRRVGKTLLSLKHIEDKPHLYLFISKKSEPLLCKEFLTEIKNTFPTPVHGDITTFKDVFALLLEIAKTTPFVLVIDEFQEFFKINPSVYSDCQKLWDLNKATAKIQVLFLGSVYSLMHKIFKDSKEPLFGRADRYIHLRPFSPKELYALLCENGYSDFDTLFTYYLFTGGTPKYIHHLLTEKAFTEMSIIDFMLSSNSPFLDEGKNILIEEFGKEYGIYFSILELMAAGKTTRAEIESIIQKDIGGYIERLDKDYAIIKSFKPITAKPNAKLQKYHIRDGFLQFWFRFIYRNRTAVETQNFEYIKAVLKRDLSTFKGKILERFFYELFAGSHQFNQIGSYWEKDGSNEIDLVAVNDLEKRLVIAEVKLNKDKYSENLLKAKAQKLIRLYPAYKTQYLGLSLENAHDYL